MERSIDTNNGDLMCVRSQWSGSLHWGSWESCPAVIKTGVSAFDLVEDKVNSRLVLVARDAAGVTAWKWGESDNAFQLLSSYTDTNGSARITVHEVTGEIMVAYRKIDKNLFYRTLSVNGTWSQEIGPIGNADSIFFPKTSDGNRLPILFQNGRAGRYSELDWTPQ